MKDINISCLSEIQGGSAATDDIGQFIGGFAKGYIISAGNLFQGLVTGFVAAARA